MHDETLTFDAFGRIQTLANRADLATYTYHHDTAFVADIDYVRSGETSASQHYGYDRHNRQNNASASFDSQPLHLADLSRDNLGRVTQMTLADDSYWEYGYDGLNQITSAVKRDSTGNALPGYTFGYGFDTIGNRESVTRETTTETYSPNPLNQIESINHAGQLHLLGTAAPSANVTLNTQSVSRADNLYYGTATGNNSLETITIEGRITGAGHNGTDAVAIVEGEAYIPAGPTTRTHDESGNLTEDARWLYTWDAENRLVQIETRPAGQRPHHRARQRPAHHHRPRRAQSGHHHCLRFPIQ